MDEIIQLKVTLKHTKPAIWRRIQVKEDTTFFELHHIIQIAFGWENYHLYEFKADKYRIGEPSDDMEEYGDGLLDASEIKLDKVLTAIDDKFDYEYDFGDCWEHAGKVEAFLPADPNITYPVCIDGKLNCPPEDCGGVGGFYDMLEIIGNKKHPEYKEMIDWVGEGYSPKHFDIKQCNMTLSLLDAYIDRWLKAGSEEQQQ